MDTNIMMAGNKFRIVCFSLFITLNSFAQENIPYDKEITSYIDFVSNEFGIKCNSPKGFSNMEKFYVIWKVRANKNKHTGSLYGPIFLSKDKECIVMYPALTIRYSDLKNLKLSTGMYIRNQIMAEIKTAINLYYSPGNSLNNNSENVNFNNYVTIIAGKKPRDMFNADSLFIYNIPDGDSVFFFDKKLENLRKRKYPYCTGVVINKIDRPALDIKFFFTPKGVKSMDKYLNMLKTQVWYDDNFKFE